MKLHSPQALLVLCLCLESCVSFAPRRAYVAEGRTHNHKALPSSASTMSSPSTSSAAAGTTTPGKVTAPEILLPQDTPEAFERAVQKTYGRYPLTITHGKGCKLYDSDNKEYLDFVAGIASCALGHANEELAEAVAAQMKQLHHISNLYYIPEQAALASWLCENSVADKVFFCNSGAESNEGAIKLARRHASNRDITDPVIIVAEQSFHGRTLAALSATAQPKYHKGFSYGGEMVQGFKAIPYNDIDALKQTFAEMNTTPENDAAEGRTRGVAAILMEPLQGEGGIIPGDAQFFQTARQLCDDTGALLICDEVQAGMGRTGTLWGYQQVGVEPDVFTSAKALGGGVPIGAMMARGVAADVFGPGDHASTYGGNPLACRAGLAVARYFAENDILTNVQERGDQLSKGLEAIAAKYPSVLGGVRGWGLLKGIAVKDEADCTASDLVGDAMKEGLLLVPAGAKVVRFVPPLIVTEEEVKTALTIFETTVANRAKEEEEALTEVA